MKLDWDAIKYVYAFGDSYTFVQGTAGHANYSFIGDALNYSFSSEELLSNEIVPKNTSSEGSNWLEFLTGCFSGSPATCDKQLWDFAFAGSDIDGNLLPLHHDFTVPLVDQVNQWVLYASEAIPHPLRETLTAWWIGINDTGDTVDNHTITDINAFWEAEMSSYFGAVQSAYDNGLKQHLFINVPPEERSPAANTNTTKAGILKSHVDGYNAALKNHVQLFTRQNQDAIALIFDANTWFNSVLDYPATYGFDDVTDYCTCADPAGYFWYNTGHPTERVHRLLAEAINKGLRSAR
ncbi:uncharacterized protein BT62DRAFT_909739 [Guyanagaster necrorhizus]|uniref:Carbohydrate esterase family 16 protein n=1 Tax=Guyanagaster necrorhizus TaxID=856835 RepID=A0A9P7VIX7_9AGAR|nr:uncharacterized protein BT62DRAFT_909739 [Guyanagaster necrorhizus MCA 3950]KAG7440876.1 hypothetical protein BT62DRAFT_909739 [Guyanagaster necrorhizus MCA 3950]